MQVYQTDHQGFYVGPTTADPDQLDEGNWLIPAGCVTEHPPAIGEMQKVQWVSNAWVVVDVQQDQEVDPIPSAPTIEQQKFARADAYRDKADPLFFKAQRGEATMDEWLSIVAEIKTRYPYPT